MKLKYTPFLLAAILLISLAGSGCSAEIRKTRSLKRAEQHFKAGEYDKAKIEYMKVLRIDPRDATAFKQLGTIWYDQGALLRSGAFLKRATELDPEDTPNRIRLARAYQATGNKEEAKSEAMQVLQRSPGDGDALVILSELSYSPEEIEATEQALEGSAGKETSLHHIARANLALRRQNLSAAEAAVYRALILAPQSPEVHQAKGLILLLKRDMKAAREEFKAAAELAPLRSKIRLNYAEYQAQTEGPAAATSYLKDLTSRAPDYMPAWIALGRIAFSEKRYDDALKALENVFSRDPDNLEGHALEADVLLATNETQKALSVLERLDTAYPGVPAIKFRLAQAYLQDKKVPQAVVALDQALAANPNYTEAILLRAQLTLQNGNAAAAIGSLEDLLKKQPDLKPAKILLADAYRAAGRLEDAANILRGQIKTAPEASENYFFLGLIQRQQKKIEEARQSFQKAQELAPDNLTFVGQLTELDMEEKNFEAAMGRVQNLMEKQPNTAPPYLLEGKVRIAQKQWAEAEAALRKALELDPNLGVASDLLVSIYIATDKLPQAVAELENVLAKSPTSQGALMTMGVIQEKLKDYAKARDAYEKLLALSPDFVAPLNNLAYIYTEHLVDLDKAHELARKARTLDPANPAVADTLGWVLLKRGEYQQAQTLLQEAADKFPDNSEIAFHVGMAHYMMGQTDAARSAFQRALSSSTDFPSKSDAQSRLALLGAEAGQEQSMTVEQLEQLLGQEPNDLIARLRLAEAYEKQSAWANAVGAYEAALKLNPKLGSVALKLAQLYSGPSLNKEKALSYAKMARELSPVDRKATTVLGRIAYDTGDYSWAYNLLQEGARPSDANAEVLHDFAWAAYSLGKVDEARQAMERAANASPAPAIAEDAKSFLALTSVDAPPAADLKSVVEAKLQKDAKYVPALMAGANLDLQSGAGPKAIERYQEVLQRFPDFGPAQYHLAALYAEDPARLAEAHDLASKARKSRPDDPTVAQLLGQLSYERKDYSRALQFLQESARKKPLDATGLYYLGMSYKEKGQAAQAAETLTAALSAGLPAALEPEARKALEEAKK